jgi:hypothetical protein
MSIKKKRIFSPCKILLFLDASCEENGEISISQLIHQNNLQSEKAVCD